MGGPYESLGDDRIALIVDLEPSAIHEPRPGPLDDPALGEDFEPVRVDPRHHPDADVMTAAVLDEGGLEPRVTPELREAPGVNADRKGAHLRPRTR